MSAKKTLLISEIFPPKVGGSGRWFWEIYSRLEAERHLVAAGTDPLAGEYDLGHQLHCLRWPLALKDWGVTSFSAAGGYLRVFRLLRNAVKSHGIGAIHCGRGLPEGLLGWLAWKWFRVPYLCYVHGEELPTYHCSREYRFLSRLVYGQARRIVVNSKNTYNSFVAHTGISGTVRIMNPGVDTEYFTPAADDAALREKLGWSGRKVILTVGRLQKRKGHDHVILAMQLIRRRFPDALYVIAGDGSAEERTALEKLVADHNMQGHVQFLGQVDDAAILRCYQQCDLFVLANREVDGDFEGFGMVLVEAQSCGRPVVAGSSGGTAETMLPGETGLLVDATRPEAIAEAVVAILGDDQSRREMGARAAAWVRGRFDWQVLVAQAASIFSEL